MIAPALTPTTEAAFVDWMCAARPGDASVYHRGLLAADRSNGSNPKLARLANCALWAAERQLVHLVQRRHGPKDYAYLAIARPRLDHTPHSVLKLMPKEAA
ncbi:MAG: hypothetical protein AB7O88_22055 [Reyranellaceae bacterium]